MLETIAKHFAWPDSDALMYFVRSQHQWQTRATKKRVGRNFRHLRRQESLPPRILGK
jgi:hypothetical protein